ncbi:hypothetical protein P3T76_002725 [Phytophthora citrophthora]|uniref:Uncharacterized protein n=1 Tax=Phytophthora citrophthora TaxID=4793 RepID=A0AAD9GVR9_9STRA|nr:hypothetical protein P3T76_002725 [Phytophthora citrophthora]
MWLSVIRFKSDLSWATALVMHRTPKHMYLLVNLHTLIAEYDDEDVGKRKPEPPRESPRNKKQWYSSDLPKIELDQLLPGNTTLTERVCTFRFHRIICWVSSARRDYAILKIPMLDTETPGLTPLVTSDKPEATMEVHVFGFPGVFNDNRYETHYAITPAQVTSMGTSQVILQLLAYRVVP